VWTNPFDISVQPPFAHDCDDEPQSSGTDRYNRRDAHNHRVSAPGDQDLAEQIRQGRITGNVRVFLRGHRPMGDLRLHAGRVAGNPGECRDALHRGDHSGVQDPIWLMPVFYLARPCTAEMSLFPTHAAFRFAWKRLGSSCPLQVDHVRPDPYSHRFQGPLAHLRT
jgi:hypothetical protein